MCYSSPELLLMKHCTMKKKPSSPAKDARLYVDFESIYVA